MPSLSWIKGLPPEVFALVRHAFRSGWAAAGYMDGVLDEQDCWELHVEHEVLTEQKEAQA
jgi:hypothetical protein